MALVIVALVMFGVGALAVIGLTRGVRRQAAKPMARVDYWMVPHRPRTVDDQIRSLGFEPLGAVRLGDGDGALYKSVSWSDRQQAFARVLSSGAGRVPVPGSVVSFVTPLHGGTVLTTGSVPEGVVANVLEQGFPRSTVDELLERHADALEFLAAHGIDSAPCDPDAWFDQLLGERAEELAALQAMHPITITRRFLKVMFGRGAGPLERQPRIVDRLRRPPFSP